MSDHFGQTWLRYFAALEARIADCDDVVCRRDLIESLEKMKQRARTGRGRAPSHDLRHIDPWSGTCR
jgi:hypothetical protein